MAEGNTQQDEKMGFREYWHHVRDTFKKEPPKPTKQEQQALELKAKMNAAVRLKEEWALAQARKKLQKLQPSGK